MVKSSTADEYYRGFLELSKWVGLLTLMRMEKGK